jgi:hypothetical protein
VFIQAEHFFGKPHVKTRAVVLDEEHLAVGLAPATELDAGLPLLRGELIGVSEQVLQHQTQQRRVAGGLHAARNYELDAAPGVLRAQVVG